jgi:hypothetical protein
MVPLRSQHYLESLMTNRAGVLAKLNLGGIQALKRIMEGQVETLNTNSTLEDCRLVHSGLNAVIDLFEQTVELYDLRVGMNLEESIHIEAMRKCITTWYDRKWIVVLNYEPKSWIRKD